MKTQKRPLVVLLSGKQGSGKTTLAENIQTRFDLLLKGQALLFPIKFADTIYLMHTGIYGIMEQYGIPRPETKDGDLLQVLGTDWGRKKFGPDIWAQITKLRVERVFAKARDIGKICALVEDCRFENEFDYFPDALTVRLQCEKEIRMERCEYWRDNDVHQSEVDLDGYSAEQRFDIYINTGKTNQNDAADQVFAEILTRLGVEIEKKKSSFKSQAV